jgi:hypothetical protein
MGKKEWKHSGDMCEKQEESPCGMDPSSQRQNSDPTNRE